MINLLLKIGGELEYEAIHSYGERVENRLFSLKVIKLSKRRPLSDAIESEIFNLLHIDGEVKSPLNYLMARYSFRLLIEIAE